MGGITRVGDKCTGHDACPPVALASGSPNVFINGRSAGRAGDPYEAHGCKDHPSHVGTIASGAPHVFINGRPAARVGDSVSCGGTVAEGSSNVTIGEGGGEVFSNMVKASVSKNLFWDKSDETGKTILSTPEIAKNVASKLDGANAKG